MLCEYLGVNHVALFANGTLVLITALQALRVTGEVITTPYSFVATARSLLWHGNKPVFVDVDSKTLNMDPAKLRLLLLHRRCNYATSIAMRNPCDVEAIQK